MRWVLFLRFLAWWSAATLCLVPATAQAGGIDVDLSRVVRSGDLMKAPLAGGGLATLTLDGELQERIEKLLEESRAPSGAIVMSDAKTGRILAWASRGSSDDLVSVPAYPGASLYKVVTAAALLENEHVYRGTPQCYGGGRSRLELSDVESLCKPGENKIKFGEALGHSVNVVFGRLALAHLQASTLERTATSLGIGDDLNADVVFGPSTVDVPDDDPLGLARSAAGFNRAGVTPLSALFMMQTIANEGERVRLQLLGEPSSIRRATDGRAIKETTANALVKMLEVTTRSGTSREAFEDKPGRANVRVAGKTGTLIVKSPARLVSWFAGFAPSRSPEVVVSVMLANDLKWWRKGNSVARDALDAYFALQQERSGA